MYWVGLALLWFGAAGLYPLMDPDEGRYAEIPREMAASGDWITPRLDGLKYFEKPPLQYWATAALYKGFGVNEWTARGWTLALAFLCLPLTFAWVRRFYGQPAGWAAMAVLAASPFFVILGHLNLLDAAFTFWLTAAIFAFTRAQLAQPGSSDERNNMLCAWLAAALAVLSKGMVAPVLAGFALLAYSIVQHDWRTWRRLHIVLGLPLFLLVATPWFVVVSLRNAEFPEFFFLHEHFARFLTNVSQHVEPWWFFAPVLALGLLPWLTELPGAIRRAWSAREPAREFQPLRFLLIYAGATLLFFSVSHSKLAPYILPMLPPLAVVLGVHIAERPRSLRRGAWIAAVTIAIVAGGLVVYTLRRYDAAPVPLVMWTFVAVMLAFIAALNVKVRHSQARNIAWLAVGSVLAWQCLMTAHGTPPLARSARALVAAVQPAIREQTALFNVGQYRQTIPPYLGRTLTLVGYTGELEFGMRQEPERNVASLPEFEQQWRASLDAVAFFDRTMWRSLAATGLPGRVLAEDRYTVAVSRR